MVELKSEGQTFDKPAWLGKDVTGDPKYYNANLVKHPYSKW
jgi:CYTH domain-containing protein